MDKKELKEKIHKQIHELEESLPSLKEAAKPVQLDTAQGRVSRIDAIRAQGVHERSYKSALNKLSALKTNFEQIDTDEFGLCIECDEPIQPKRILAMPESRVCIRCAGKK